MSEIVCECGHPISFHDLTWCTDDYCACRLGSEEVEARYWARRMKTKCDTLQRKLDEMNKLVMEWGNHIHYLEAKLDIAKSMLDKAHDIPYLVDGAIDLGYKAKIERLLFDVIKKLEAE